MTWQQEKKADQEEVEQEQEQEQEQGLLPACSHFPTTSSFLHQFEHKVLFDLGAGGEEGRPAGAGAGVGAGAEAGTCPLSVGSSHPAAFLRLFWKLRITIRNFPIESRNFAYQYFTILLVLLVPLVSKLTCSGVMAGFSLYPCTETIRVLLWCFQQHWPGAR